LGTPVGSKLLPVVLAASVLLLFFGLSAAARAGTYTVHYCQTPEAAGPMTEWRVDKGPTPSIEQQRENCPGGPYELELDPAKTHLANDVLTSTIEAPPGTEIESYKFWRAYQLGPSYGYRYNELTAFGAAEHDQCYPSSTSSCTKGNPAEPFGKSNLWEMHGRTGVTGLEFVVTCAKQDTSNEQCTATSPGAKFELFGAELTLTDDSAPVLPVAPSGPLVAPGVPLSGREPVTISATDSGSGVYEAMLEVDGSIVSSSIVDEDGGSCRAPFTHIAPCPTSAAATVWLDTAKLADGEHSLRILVTDATGTNTTAWGPVTIETDNGRCNPRPATDELQMQAGVVGVRHSRARIVTTRYGRSLRVRGRLTDTTGKPVPGASVCMAERDAAGIGELHLGAVGSTDPKGYFSFKVAPGPSRRLYFVHRTAAGAAVSSIEVRVQAPVMLHGAPLSLRNGQTLTMRGRLGSGPYPKHGGLVELQAYRETGWQTFGTANTNKHGRFIFRYTFSRTVGIQHYFLRARVPTQANYPFVSGASRPIRVTVSS
jgi:hypothetical protein